MKKPISFLQVCLTVVSVACLLISNVITAKQMLLPFGVTMTCAVFVFPVTYILSDVFSEVYGYKWSRITCYMGFALNVFMVFVFELSIRTPAPDYWQNQAAFECVLGNAPRVLCASLLAFVMGDFINDVVFKKLKAKHPDSHKGFKFRAFLSSLCGEIVDSAIFIPIAFIGQMPVSALFYMGIIQITLKTLYEIVILPVTGFVVKKVSMYEENNGVVKCHERSRMKI